MATRKRWKNKREKSPSPPPRGRRPTGQKMPNSASACGLRYSTDVRLKAVKLYLEEGIPAEVIARELGVSHTAVYYWLRRYRQVGAEGLRSGACAARGPKPSTGVHNTIAAVKREHPDFGIQRIAQFLKRMLFLPVSRETVRRTLHRERLMLPAKKKTPRNPSKPRFFERSTPNQMWQSDIFPFKLGGAYAYLIGFIDDHSRYLTALEVFRGQTADNVLEVYRRGVGAYGVPKEMLTDNGRQYTNWRGKTAFEKELAKDRVHHFRSAPHHPQTLGKIERFWKTIWEEFLVKARFETFEEARERIAWWVKYYNHQRPHQGIEGLCPADRFFAIQKELQVAMAQGIEANVQELALRGRPAKPFYVVGRMGDQSLTIRAERGTLQMNVEDRRKEEERIYEVGNQSGTGDGENTTESAGAFGAGEGPGGADGMGGKTAGGYGVPGAGDQLGDLQPVGAEGPGGDVAGVGSARGAGGAGVESGAATGAVAGGAETGGRAGGVESGDERVIREEEIEHEKFNDERGVRAERAGAMPGGAEYLDGTADSESDVPGSGDSAARINAVAGSGDGGYDAGVVSPGSPGGAEAGPGGARTAVDGAVCGGTDGDVSAPGAAVGGCD